MELYWVPSTVSSALFGTDLADLLVPGFDGRGHCIPFRVLKILFEQTWVIPSSFRNTQPGWRFEITYFKLEIEELERAGRPRPREHEGVRRINPQRQDGGTVWSMGITQHAFGGDAVHNDYDLGLTKGFVGRDKMRTHAYSRSFLSTGGPRWAHTRRRFPGQTDQCLRTRGAFAALWFPGAGSPRPHRPEMVEACARATGSAYCLGGNFCAHCRNRSTSARHWPRALRVHQDIISRPDVLSPLATR